MSNRYRFRAKRKDNNEWIYGVPRKNIYNDMLMVGDAPFRPEIIDEKTLGQCTGLKDKNGKVIFEGDIITEGHVIHEVYYDKYYGFRKCESKLDREKYQSGLQSCGWSEITGTIHDA